ncbi:MAG: PHP domain-containing protein [Treponema sp.]|jgi:predicted metal-dependent phosphoesterase TrpH|nr:PHP domain-containing protein [Treponema sp.]
MRIFDMLFQMIDLHTHSSISDGDFSPALLVREAVKNGLGAIALTDHDTINGLDSAKTEAAACGISFIPGIEININWLGGRNLPRLGSGGEFHLLGLGIIAPTPAFTAAITELSRIREARNREILEKMHELSIDITWEELLAEASGTNDSSGSPDQDIRNKVMIGHSIGRPHFASLLVKHKIVKNRNQAFARYLRIGKPLYAPKEGLAFDKAVSLIRDSGGIPVLAHPMSLFIAWGRLPGIISELKERGLAGIEAWHPLAKTSSCFRLEVLARSFDLYVTEGSDFHGLTRLNRKLGYSGRNRKIDDSVLAAIPELAQY